jgi:hypothetical protein
MAWTVHFPVVSKTIVAPFCPSEVHTKGVVVVKLTGKPDEAVAFTITGESARILAARGAKLVVCLAFDTIKLRLTGGAALIVTLPGCVARTVHFPVVSKTIVAPFRPSGMHTRGVVVVKPTGRPDVAEAPTVTGDSTSVSAASGAKSIVWPTFVIGAAHWLNSDVSPA